MADAKLVLSSGKIGASCLSAVTILLAGSVPSFSCVSLGPATFSQTKGYAGEGHRDGKLVHILAYQNTAANRSTTGGGNAMFLPIPAVAGTMTAKNIIDTKRLSHILTDMEAVVHSDSKEIVFKSVAAQSKALAAPIVFDSDVYTIVLAQDARSIPDALGKVPEAKRPTMNKEIFSAYAKWYPGWTFALCCFNNKDAVKANPMLWWYEPKDKETLFFPALDAHDGRPPDLKANVAVDHTLIFSTEALTPSTGGQEVVYSDFRDGSMPTAVAGILPRYVTGRKFAGQLPQGDFSVAIARLNAGSLKVERVMPPGVVGKTSGSAAQAARSAAARKLDLLEEKALIAALDQTTMIQDLSKHFSSKIIFSGVSERVEKNWAWIQANPQTADNKSHFDPVAAVLQKVKGQWKVVAWLDDEIAHADDPAAEYKKWREHFVKSHPGCPPAIFPEQH